MQQNAGAQQPELPEFECTDRQPDFVSDVEERWAVNAYPDAPSTLTELFDWPPQLTQQAMDLHPLGKVLVDNIVKSLHYGIYLVSDYSGYGAPEIALSKLAGLFGRRHRVTFYRASDLLRERRENNYKQA